MRARARRWMVLALVAAFCGQTLLVYGDATGRVPPPLTPAAQRGRALWHRRGCQACHQFHGFGGFLGPDLTNLATRAGAGLEARLAGILERGRGAMPAFHLSETDREDLAAFFVAMDATGIGQLSAGERSSSRVILARALRNAPQEDETVRAGCALADRLGCIECHSPQGPGPDATLLSRRLPEAEIDRILATGRPERGMPAFGLEKEDRQRIRAYLAWLERNGERVRRAFARAERSTEVSLSRMPWFEY